MAADWLIALDDAFCQRIRCCSLCGNRDGRPWFEIRAVGWRSIAVLICPACQQRDPQRVQLDQLLAARYGRVTER